MSVEEFNERNAFIMDYYEKWHDTIQRFLEYDFKHIKATLWQTDCSSDCDLFEFAAYLYDNNVYSIICMDWTLQADVDNDKFVSLMNANVGQPYNEVNYAFWRNDYIENPDDFNELFNKLIDVDNAIDVYLAVNKNTNDKQQKKRKLSNAEVRYSPEDIANILRDMANYVEDCNNEEYKGYFEDLAKTGLFHDAEGKPVEVEEDGSVICLTEY